MKTILLTLLAVASLTIAAQAQTASNVTQGAVTGSAEHSDGSFTVFRAAPVVTLSFVDKFSADMKAAFTAALDDLEAPTVWLPNGVVTRKSTSTNDYNHDGQAFQGFPSAGTVRPIVVLDQ